MGQGIREECFRLRIIKTVVLVQSHGGISHYGVRGCGYSPGMANWSVRRSSFNEFWNDSLWPRLVQ